MTAAPRHITTSVLISGVTTIGLLYAVINLDNVMGDLKGRIGGISVYMPIPSKNQAK